MDSKIIFELICIIFNQYNYLIFSGVGLNCQDVLPDMRLEGIDEGEQNVHTFTH